MKTLLAMQKATFWAVVILLSAAFLINLVAAIIDGRWAAALLTVVLAAVSWAVADTAYEEMEKDYDV
jgi:hypothetical protein